MYIHIDIYHLSIYLSIYLYSHTYICPYHGAGVRRHHGQIRNALDGAGAALYTTHTHMHCICNICAVHTPMAGGVAQHIYCICNAYATRRPPAHHRGVHVRTKPKPQGAGQERARRGWQGRAARGAAGHRGTPARRRRRLRLRLRLRHRMEHGAGARWAGGQREARRHGHSTQGPHTRGRFARAPATRPDSCPTSCRIVAAQCGALHRLPLHFVRTAGPPRRRLAVASTNQQGGAGLATYFPAKSLKCVLSAASRRPLSAMCQAGTGCAVKFVRHGLEVGRGKIRYGGQETGSQNGGGPVRGFSILLRSSHHTQGKASTDREPSGGACLCERCGSPFWPSRFLPTVCFPST